MTNDKISKVKQHLVDAFLGDSHDRTELLAGDQIYHESGKPALKFDIRGG